MSERQSAPTAVSWDALLGGLRQYAVFAISPEGVINSWNSGVQELLGYEEAEFVGQNASIIFTPEDRDERKPELEFAAARDDGEAKDDRWHLRKDGSRLWANGVMRCARDERGTVIGYMKLMRDVTETRLAQAHLEEQNRFISAVLASLPGVFYMMDDNGLVQWNDELAEVTGLSSEELSQATVDDLIVEADEVRQQIDTVLKVGEGATEGHLRSRGGVLLPYLFTGRRVQGNGRTLVLGVGIDIGDQLAARRGLERQAREQAAMADLASAAFSPGGLNSLLRLAARRIAETVESTYVQIVEEDGGVYRVRAAVDAGSATPRAGAIASESLARRAKFAARDATPGHWPTDILAPLSLKSGIHALIRGHGQPFGFLEVLSDRADAFTDEDVRFLGSLAKLLAAMVVQQRLMDELEHRADNDGLTELLTRSAFERRLASALAQAERDQTKVAVLFIDLDRFKSVNDSLGHQAGDDVLRKVALRLRESVRSWDVVARLGGDEFVLFMPNIESSAEVGHVTQRLLATLAAPFSVGGREIRIGATIGIALFPEDGRDVRTMLQAADGALYEGKERGRNTFHFFTRKQHERTLRRLQLETQLHKALDASEFRTVYQPQLDFASNSASVAETLLRWHHPRRGALKPSEFMPIANAIGLAVPVGEWSVRRALRDHASWRGIPGAPGRVAVNVSPLHFIQPFFAPSLFALAQASGVPTEEIEVEITEATLLRDVDLVTHHLRSLKGKGVRIVLDDFGTEASPLARLRQLPIDKLKINETFTHKLNHSTGRRLAASIVQMALGLGIDPIAEGIETSEQDRIVRELGFSGAQGRFYSRAVTREQLLAQLQQGPSLWRRENSD